MGRPRAGVAGLVCVAVVSVTLSACTPIIRNHGYAPTEADLEEIVVGVDTRDTVADVVGSPTVSGVMRDNAWYYVESRWRTIGYRAPEITDRQVVAISFDRNGTVANIERFGLEDGRVIALNRRVTESNIQGISFLRQLLGNIGQVTPEQFTAN
ncbi:outer membrane protein assembly factor BamE [Rhodovulum sp. P5]|uniref:outer membrane protein assembly factor BamE n=1 Tax=Rhodovulum sp. P5 TaxID=1564506 RepID=UPI0009D9EB7E|nr:outer membrane protein assembly factor BamE [Rhodovulum sp. P5]